MDRSIVAAIIESPPPGIILAIERMLTSGVASDCASRTDLLTLLVILKANVACARLRCGDDPAQGGLNT